jgi:hypothetical protein
MIELLMFFENVESKNIYKIMKKRKSLTEKKRLISKKVIIINNKRKITQTYS